MKKTDLIHYGEILSGNMEKKGISKQFVMKVLGINHYTTLDQRILDAKFSHSDLLKLREHDLI